LWRSRPTNQAPSAVPNASENKAAISPSQPGKKIAVAISHHSDLRRVTGSV